jgi:hypothetical protein
MSKKKNIKGMGEESKKKVEENAGPLERHGAPEIVPVDSDTWWHIFEKLEVDGKLDLFYNTMETVEKDEFWEGLYVLESVDTVFNSLASAGRVEEGILLLERLKELIPVQYMDKSKFYDYYLLHYYVPQGDKARMQEIIEHFESNLEDGIDY